jgi:hypothetical protein
MPAKVKFLCEKSQKYGNPEPGGNDDTWYEKESVYCQPNAGLPIWHGSDFRGNGLHKNTNDPGINILMVQAMYPLRGSNR